MGRVHFAQGDSNRGHFFVAEAEFVRAVQLAPAWALAHAMVGQCRLRQRRRRDAVESLRTALSLDALCIEAQVGMVQAQRNWPIALAGAAGGAVAALALVLALPAKAPPPPSPTAALMAKRAPLVVPFAPSHVVEPAHAPVLEAAAPAKVEVPAPAPAAAPALAAPAPAAPSAPKKRAVASVSPEKQAEASEQIQSGDKALRVGKMEEAIAAFQAALAADPSQAAAHRGMGMALVMMGREEEAKKEYQRYLRLEPKAPDADRIRRILSEK